MKIAPLREQLVFQEKQIKQDEIGNESAIWDDLFVRWCSCRPLDLTESDGSAIKLIHHKIQFTLRYDKKVLALNSLTTRISFRDQFYAIESIDGDTVPRQSIYIVAIKEEDHD
ncbi:TPA: head-tail adaptor protein [Streptococcus equi subsp. zooepidemicus]|uniref:head-tail adaptor protein n=1 Tax=Streptococcus equi TaxID=1336 RepID=UPI0013DCDDB5|nr:head-tail adaptor protein [Streptococcus equi]MCD3371465.1 head-tail adaptor protein [Streptococcus equi subsp. zooepidemicus]HEL0577982.1 head-tail adaptor protein [Streptococcus equi subsp. zooepidemicus]HEL0794708.1 head-tail adaptor protein [Streptococcus equi subsp. zooepidemicus]